MPQPKHSISFSFSGIRNTLPRLYARRADPECAYLLSAGTWYAIIAAVLLGAAIALSFAVLDFVMIRSAASTTAGNVALQHNARELQIETQATQAVLQAFASRDIPTTTSVYIDPSK